jgi:hypothetical protein
LPRRDPAEGNKVVFDLADAPEWQWLIGQDSPVRWRKAQANPVRKVGAAITQELRSRRPHHADAGQGWSLGEGICARPLADCGKPGLPAAAETHDLPGHDPAVKRANLMDLMQTVRPNEASRAGRAARRLGR